MSGLKRIAIFGDLSGYLEPLRQGLYDLGVDLNSGVIPDDLLVVQVGDLIHKGPQSLAVIDFVDRMLSLNPSQWIQLIGNHEAQHLGGPRFVKCDCEPRIIRTLERWKTTGALRLATAVSAKVGPTTSPLLVTHAGLSRPLWDQLGQPVSVKQSVARLNSLLDEDLRSAFASGAMLRGGPVYGLPGVVWAHTPLEVYATWWDHEPPFGQVHGHVTPYMWKQRKWADSTPISFRATAHVDAANRVLTTEVGGQPFIAVDPGFTARSAAPRQGAWLRPGLLLA